MNRYQAIAAQIRGPLTPVLTAFTAEGRVDIEATCRWVDWLIARESPLPLFAYTRGRPGVSADLLRRIIDIP